MIKAVVVLLVLLLLIALNHLFLLTLALLLESDLPPDEVDIILSN